MSDLARLFASAMTISPLAAFATALAGLERPASGRLLVNAGRGVILTLLLQQREQPVKQTAALPELPGIEISVEETHQAVSLRAPKRRQQIADAAGKGRELLRAGHLLRARRGAAGLRSK